MEQVNSAAAMIGAAAAILHMARVLLLYSAWQASWLSLQRASLAVVLVRFSVTLAASAMRFPRKPHGGKRQDCRWPVVPVPQLVTGKRPPSFPRNSRTPTKSAWESCETTVP